MSDNKRDFQRKILRKENVTGPTLPANPSFCQKQNYCKYLVLYIIWTIWLAIKMDFKKAMKARKRPDRTP